MRKIIHRFSSSINQKQMDTFNNIKSWWDPNGPMHILYEYNYHRTQFLTANIKKYKKDFNKVKPLQDLQVLDVGCGAGILSQSLTRLGGKVLAIDPNQNSIKEALQHKQGDLTLANLQYRQVSLEELLVQPPRYDLVTSMEVVEHVDRPDIFIENISKILNPYGCVMLSTISRTALSYLTHIVLAEYVTRIVPIGTHEHSKFINMNELERMLLKADLKPLNYLALDLDLSGKFVESRNGSNYLVFAQRNSPKID